MRTRRRWGRASLSAPLSVISGTFYRIVFQDHVQDALAGARSPEGRFHHDSQAALYVSSSPDWAYKAIEAYLKPDDPPRAVVPVEIDSARVVDLRDAAMCSAIGIEPADAAVPWLPERADNRPATTWRTSDASRQIGADGMIYTARSMPARWHLVMFRWNAPGCPFIRVTGAPVPLMLR